MFETTRRSLGYQLARLQFRSKRDAPMTFTASLSGSKRILLVLPLTPVKDSPAPVLDLLRTRYGEEHCTIVAEALDNGITALMPRSEIVRISAQDLTKLYHPPAGLLMHLGRRQYDAAIDLNLDFLLPSAYICKASGARVRVGFTRPAADLFFNLQVQPGTGPGLYQRLAACLMMF